MNFQPILRASNMKKLLAVALLLLGINAHAIGNWRPQDAGYISYTTPGTYTFTLPAGVNTIRISGAAAGGGGSDQKADGTGSAWDGGGGGGIIDAHLRLNTGDSLTIVVGAGGAAGVGNTTGGTGGNTTITAVTQGLANISASEVITLTGGAGGNRVGTIGGTGGNCSYMGVVTAAGGAGATSSINDGAISPPCYGGGGGNTIGGHQGSSAWSGQALGSFSGGASIDGSSTTSKGMGGAATVATCCAGTVVKNSQPGNDGFVTITWMPGQ